MTVFNAKILAADSACKFFGFELSHIEDFFIFVDSNRLCNCSRVQLIAFRCPKNFDFDKIAELEMKF